MAPASSVYMRLKAAANKDSRGCPELLRTLDDGGASCQQLAAHGLRLSEWSIKAPGRALYSTADHSLHLAVVAKRLPAGDHKAAERLRKAAPAEAESFALRVEQDQEAAGHDFAAVASAVCFAPGRLEFVLAPLPAGTTPTCYSAFRRCRSALGKVLRPPASPPPAAFAFPPADPISPASTVVGGEDLGTPTLGNGAAMGAAGAAFASPRWEDADAALPVSLEAALTSAAELDAGEASPAAEEAPAAPVPADPIATACALPTAELSADAVAAPPAISTATSCCAEEAECAAPAGTATWLEEPCFVLELESRPPAAATHEPRCATAPALDCCADASTATASTPAGCAAVASPAKEGSAATDLVAASAPAVLPAASPARTTRRLCYALGALAGLSSGMLVALRLRKRCG